MLHLIGLVLRIIFGGVGIFLIYASFSYETEDGKIQNLLEKWWIRIDDLRHQAISSHIAFMKVLASVLTSFFDRLFGNRIVGFQSLGVSICYSIVCFGITVFVLSRLNPTPDAASPFSMIWLIAFGIGYGSIPALISKDTWQPRWLSWIQVWFWLLIISGLWQFFNPWGSIILFGLTHSLELPPESRIGAFFLILFILSIALSIVFAMFMFTVFVGLMRATLRTVARSESPIKITALTLLNASPVVTFYGFIKIVEVSAKYEGGFGRLLLFFVLIVFVCALMFNLALVLSAVLSICLAIAMLLHRLLYPSIQRPLYYLQRLKVEDRPLRFRLIGLALIGAAIGKYEWLSALIEKF